LHTSLKKKKNGVTLTEKKRQGRGGLPIRSDRFSYKVDPLRESGRKTNGEHVKETQPFSCNRGKGSRG